MTRALFGLLCVALLGALSASPAVSQDFGSCADGGYLALFDERLETTPYAYDCNERLRLEVMTEDGPRVIRLIHDVAADWAMAPGIVGEAERGLRAAATALERIGPFRMDHVTVLLIDGLPPRDPDTGDFGTVAGETGATVGTECRIGLYLLSAGGDPAHMAFALAHEVFHCVQLASLTPAQMATGAAGAGRGGDWWLEGSAEWFAALAVPDPGPLPDRIEIFNEISPEISLHDMAYAGVVFFLWLGQEQGPAAVLPFLRRMAGTAAAAAQRTAMAGALPADDWLRFAQAYLDGEIRHPHGTALPFAPIEGEEWLWESTRTETIRLDPFVLTRGWLVFECGRWATEVGPTSSHAVQADGQAWGALPASIEAEEGAPARFRFAGMAAAGDTIELRIEGRVEAGCQPCADSRAIDQCLVGAWQQSGGGAVEWMRRNMPPGMTIPNFQADNQVMVLQDDGTYWTAPASQEITIMFEHPLGMARADGRGVAQSSGRWSAEGGRLNLCADSEGLAGQAVITPPGSASLTMPLTAPPAAGPLAFAYSCAGGAMETRLSFPGIGDPMVTSFTLMAPLRE